MTCTMQMRQNQNPDLLASSSTLLGPSHYPKIIKKGHGEGRHEEGSLFWSLAGR